MTQSLITRLVVGEPTTLALGVPVGQTLVNPTGRSLRWRAGTWVGAGTPRLEWLMGLRRKRQPQAIVLRPAAGKGGARSWRRVVAGGLIALSVGAAIPVVTLTIRSGASTSSALPITPAPTAGAVRVVAAAYVPPPPTPTAPADPPLPIAAGTGDPMPLPPAAPTAVAELAKQAVAELPKAGPVRVAEKEPPAPPKQPPVPPKQPPAPAKQPATPPKQRAAPAKEPPAPAKQPAAAPKHEPVVEPKPAANAPKEQPVGTAKPGANPREQQPPSAVLLDEAAPRATREGRSVAAPVSPQPATIAASAAVPPGLAKPAAVAQALKPALKRGTGLIAITPDGKVAVFTNPKTRLPQQFKIGDQLPNGDTLRTIDAKEGKVVSSSTEYTLD